MKKLIIVGNGFDLHHGIPTDYPSFLKWHLSNEIEKLLKNEECGSQVFDLKLTETSEIDFQPNLLDSISKIAEYLLKNNGSGRIINYDYRIFKIDFTPKSDFAREILSSMNERNWVDIEMEYFEQIKILLKNYGASKSQRLSVVNSLTQLNGELEYLLDELKKYLVEIVDHTPVQQKFGRWANSPIPTKHITEKHHIRKVPRERLQVTGRERSIQAGDVMFLNFNYTGRTKELLDFRQAFKHVYIHGSLYNDKYPPIFGFGDEVGEEYSEFV